MFEDAYEYLRERTASAAEAARKIQDDAGKSKGIGRRIQLPRASS